MLKFWLKRDFLRRGLRWLREHAAKPLFARFRNGRELRFVSSEPVSLETNYVDWVSPLLQLPKEASNDDRKAAIEELLVDQPLGMHSFPVQSYLQSLGTIDALEVELVHRCKVSRLPIADLPEPSEILIYNHKGTNPQTSQDHKMKLVKQNEV